MRENALPTAQMRRILFIDRDGTLIHEPQPSQQVDAYEKLAFLPHVLIELHKVAAEGYELVMVTNQDGLGTDSFPEQTFWPVHNLMMQVLESQGIHFSEVLIDKTFGANPGPGRKPAVGMLQHFLTAEDIDWQHSYVIGDRLTDVQLAQNLGCGGAIYILSEQELAAKQEYTHWITTTNINPDRPQLAPHQVKLVSSWLEITPWLVGTHRKVQWQRHTHETKIDISLNLDGSGMSQIDTGLGFFNHMLDQIARHGGLDLSITTKGDLHIDEHHTIEDTAIALGEAFRAALGNKKGINRYGFVLPMDDAQAQVALDFGGRAWLVWEAEFKREKVGDMPTELFYHFFKSFSDAAAANLQIKVSGDNEHHKIEAIFKGLAKCIKQAAALDLQRLNQLPSTKGTL